MALDTYYKQYGSLYGENSEDLSLHFLSHLCEAVREYGPLSSSTTLSYTHYSFRKSAEKKVSRRALGRIMHGLNALQRLEMGVASGWDDSFLYTAVLPAQVPKGVQEYLKLRSVGMDSFKFFEMAAFRDVLYKIGDFVSLVHSSFGKLNLDFLGEEFRF
jgi:hypothetical protein